jgi:RecA-family ATPase
MTNIQNNVNISNGFDQRLVAHVAELEQELNKPTKSKLVTATELLERGLVEVPKLISPIFQRVGVAAVVGSSDTGKSSFLRQMAIAVATGQKDFLGFEIKAKHRSVIYASTEDDENSTASLLLKFSRGQTWNYDRYKGLRFLFDTEHLTQTLDATLTEQAADLVVIDAFSDLYSGAMNEGNKVRGFLNEFNQLAQKHECLIVFLHHCGKRTEDQAPNKSSIIGSQSFEAKMRLVIELRQDWQEPMYRHLCIVKGNYLSSEYKTESYVLRFDENMMFHETGRRVPFEQLARPTYTEGDGQSQYDSLAELIAEGKSQNEAAELLGIGKAKASRLKAKYGGVSKVFQSETVDETVQY